MNKKLGILGGMGPLATVDFVRRIVEKSPVHNDQEHIPMIISNDPAIPDRSQYLLQGGANPLKPLQRTLKMLQSSGATKVVIPCNTAHYWLDKLGVDSSCFISIIDSVVAEVSARRMNTVGILATSATIKTGLYAERLQESGKAVLIPSEDEQAQVMSGIYAVKSGQIESGTVLLAREFERLIDRGADGVILGCTEIPLCLNSMPDERQQRSLDSLDLLADQCVRYYYA